MDADGGGNVTAAWVRSAADTSLVMSSLPPGAPWTAPAAVAGATGAPNDAVVASNTAGDAAAVWSQNIGGGVPDSGNEQGSRRRLDDPRPDQPERRELATPTVAVGPSGDVIAAWVRPLSSSADVVQMTLTSAGGGWLAGPTNVSDGSHRSSIRRSLSTRRATPTCVAAVERDEHVHGSPATDERDRGWLDSNRHAQPSQRDGGRPATRRERCGRGDGDLEPARP